MTTLKTHKFREMEPQLWDELAAAYKEMKRLVSSCRAPARKLRNVRRLHVKAEGLFLKYLNYTRDHRNRLLPLAVKEMKRIIEAERSISRLIGGILRVCVVSSNQDLVHDQVVLQECLSLFVGFLDKMS